MKKTLKNTLTAAFAALALLLSTAAFADTPDFRYRNLLEGA